MENNRGSGRAVARGAASLARRGRRPRRMGFGAKLYGNENSADSGPCRRSYAGAHKATAVFGAFGGRTNRDGRKCGGRSNSGPAGGEPALRKHGDLLRNAGTLSRLRAFSGGSVQDNQSANFEKDGDKAGHARRLGGKERDSRD